MKESLAAARAAVDGQLDVGRCGAAVVRPVLGCGCGWGPFTLLFGGWNIRHLEQAAAAAAAAAAATAAVATATAAVASSVRTRWVGELLDLGELCLLALAPPPLRVLLAPARCLSHSLCAPSRTESTTNNTAGPQ